MKESESPPRSSGALALARASFSAVLAVALLANLPLAILLGLKAQFRDLAHPGGDPAPAAVTEVYEADALPRRMAFSLEPEAVLQSRALATPEPDPKSYGSPEAAPVAGPGWGLARRIVPPDDTAGDRPPLRAYDPVGPPFDLS